MIFTLFRIMSKRDREEHGESEKDKKKVKYFTPSYKRDRIEQIIEENFDVELRDSDLPSAIPIYPVKEEKSDQIIFGGDLDPRIPQHPFRIILVAPSGTGKTTILVNFVLRPEFYFDYFNEIYIISPSIYTDYKWKPVRDTFPEEDKHKFLFESFDSTVIARIVENQRTIIRELDGEKDLAPRILLIFDDILAERLFRTNSTGPLEDLFARGRQLNISIIVSSQFYKEISTRARDNPTNIVLMNIGRNKNELTKISEELSGPISDKQFNALWKWMMDPNNPHDFMHIWVEYHQPDMRFRHRFSDPEPLPSLSEEELIDDKDNVTEKTNDDSKEQQNNV